MSRHSCFTVMRGALAVAGLVALYSCGGGGGGGGGQAQLPEPLDVAGEWSIHETINEAACGGTTDFDNYAIDVQQDGSSLTVVAPAGTFVGSIVGNQVSWSGQYFNKEDGGWVTITRLSITVDGDSLEGSASWDFRQTKDGPVLCSGSTQVSGQRTGSPPAVPQAPSGLTFIKSSDSAILIEWVDGSSNEQGFHIERSLSEFARFSQVASVATGVTRYTDAGLNAGTRYYYRVRAFNGAGESDYSNTASGLTQPQPATRPLAPSELVASASASDAVALRWKDNATNESGFRVQRSLDGAAFGLVATLGADVREHTDRSGIVPQTRYHYRVIAFNDAGESGAASAAITTPAGTRTFTLRVNKAGPGQGTVTSQRIDCGSDCVESYPESTSVILVATAAGGSVFTSWSGANSANGNTANVVMNQDRVVTATFGLAPSTVKLSAPETSSTGTFFLTWTVTGLAMSPWTIQEDSDTRFLDPTSYLSHDNGSPFQHPFSGKADGTYCYRVSAPGGGVIAGGPVDGRRSTEGPPQKRLYSSRLRGRASARRWSHPPAAWSGSRG